VSGCVWCGLYGSLGRSSSGGSDMGSCVIGGGCRSWCRGGGSRISIGGGVGVGGDIGVGKVGVGVGIGGGICIGVGRSICIGSGMSSGVGVGCGVGSGGGLGDGVVGDGGVWWSLSVRAAGLGGGPSLEIMQGGKVVDAPKLGKGPLCDDRVPGD